MVWVASNFTYHLSLALDLYVAYNYYRAVPYNKYIFILLFFFALFARKAFPVNYLYRVAD